MRLKKLMMPIMFLAMGMTASLSQAETLEDCLLENLKGVTSDIAAETISNACEKKFGGEVQGNSTAKEIEINLTSEIVLTLNKPLFSSNTPEYRIPVPQGNWQKIGEAKNHRLRPPMHSEVWVNVVDGVLHHVMYVDYTKSRHQNGWTPSRLCERSNLHYIDKIEPNRRGQNQNCFAVNHFRLSGGNDQNSAVKEAKDWARKNRTAFPSTAIVHQHHLAYRKFLNFWVGYNPEVEGFPAPSDSSWDSNDWHQDRIIGDAKREAYIQKVIAAGKETHEAVVPQFDFR